jgi:hypothetical protein
LNHGVPRRRSARTETLWALGGFLFATLAFSLVVEFRCPHWRDREYQVRRAALDKQVREHPDRPVLLAIGSSRVATAFIPERVGPLRDPAGRSAIVFNYSHLGAGPRMNLIQLLRALRDGVRPAWLVLEISPALMAHDYLPAREATVEDVWQLLKYPASRPRLVYQAAVRRLTEVYSSRSPLLEWIAPPFATWPQGDGDPHIDSLGGANNWARKDHPTLEYREKYTAIAVARHQKQMQTYRIAPHTVAATRDFLELCRVNGIEVVLLLPPEDSRFLSWYGPGAEAQVQRLISELSAEFAVSAIDARRWVPDDGFSDPHHVDLTGAERFTDRLETEVLRPLVHGERPTAAGDRPR